MAESKPINTTSKFSWVSKQSFVRDPVFIRQMSLVFIIPLIFVALLLVVILWPMDSETLGFIARIVLITGVFMLALYLFVIFVVLRGRQEVRFTLDDSGVLVETAGPLKYMNIVKSLLVLSGNPTYAGIGLMAQGPQSAQLSWEMADGFLPDRQAKTITLRKGPEDLMVLFCSDENFEQVSSWIAAKLEA